MARYPDSPGRTVQVWDGLGDWNVTWASRRGRAAGGDRKLTAVLKQPRALLTRLVEVGVAPEGLGVTRSELERPR
jgi:hypothetical protein